jgi:hypothetical protein
MVEPLGERHFRAAIYKWPVTENARPVSHCLHQHRTVEAATRCLLAAFKKVAVRTRGERQ